MHRSEPAPGPDIAPGITVDPAEIARFSALADKWWDETGAFRPLHRLGPIRIGYVRDKLAAQHGRDPLKPKPLRGLNLLDIGCGGGLIAEPMTRLGARVVAIDASATNIGVAQTHAAQSGLGIDYRHTTAEDLAGQNETFDTVLALEIVEHVADLRAFLGAVAQLVKPGGSLILSTLNRTPQAYLLAVVGAEYVLRWLPAGTHEWHKFVRPSELAAALRPQGMTVREMKGISYSLLADTWRLTDDLSVNYLAFAEKN